MGHQCGRIETETGRIGRFEAESWLSSQISVRAHAVYLAIMIPGFIFSKIGILR